MWFCKILRNLFYPLTHLFSISEIFQSLCMICLRLGTLYWVTLFDALHRSIQ